MGKGDNQGGLPSAPAGQPGKASDAAPVPMAQPNPEPQGGATTPSVSEDAIMAAVNKLAESGKLNQHFEKVIQSRNDRWLNQVKKVMDAAQANGATLTEEQAGKIVAGLNPQPEPAPQASIPTMPSPAAPAQAQAAGSMADPVMAQVQLWLNEDGKPEADRTPATIEAYRRMAAAGVRLDANDPEIKGIVVDKGDAEYLTSVDAAVLAKKTRLSAQGDPGRTPALSGGGTTGQPAHAGLSGKDTLKMGIDQQIRGG